MSGHGVWPCIRMEAASCLQPSGLSESLQWQGCTSVAAGCPGRCLGGQYRRRRPLGARGVRRRHHPLASDGRWPRAACPVRARGQAELGGLDARRLLRRDAGRVRRAALACEPGFRPRGRNRARLRHSEIAPAGCAALCSAGAGNGPCARHRRHDSRPARGCMCSPSA